MVYFSVLHNIKTVGQEYLADFIGNFQYPGSFCMNIAEINLFLVRSDAIDVTGMVCRELDKLTPAAFCTELRDYLVVYY